MRTLIVPDQPQKLKMRNVKCAVIPYKKYFSLALLLPITYLKALLKRIGSVLYLNTKKQITLYKMYRNVLCIVDEEVAA